MARRKQGPAEDLLDLVAMLPWWAGVALAIASYLLLHPLAGMPKTVATQPGQAGEIVVQMVVSAFASVGQYFVPFLCLIGALISFVRRRKRESLMAGVTQSKGADALNGMSWREFEMLQRAKGAKPIDMTPAPAQVAPPSCPTCQAAMVRRTARKGAHAGSQFWGCSKYPVCRGTRS